MGKRGLCTGIIVGAAVGGLVSLFNSETRTYVKESSGKLAEGASFYASNPDLAVNQVKKAVTTVNQAITSNTDSAMNVLDQVDGSIQKFLK